MAKDKEKKINPATAALKASKTKAIKKGKAEASAKRTERLGKINPAHLQRKIQELEEAGGQDGKGLKPFERQRLHELKKQLGGVEKARGVLGDKAPSFWERREGGDGGRGGGVLGKRRRGDQIGSGRKGGEESSETEEDVRNIPWPTDSENMPRPPRRSHRNHNGRGSGQTEDNGERAPHALSARPPQVEHKTVYSSAPVLRNLEQEAVSRFVPAAVAQKLKAAKGEGGLLEPEELDRLEKLGYRNAAMQDAKGAVNEAEEEVMLKIESRQIQEGGARSLDEEERRFEEELREIEMEDEATTRDSALDAARHVVDEAIKESEYRIMADEAGGASLRNPDRQAEVAERKLRQVEMEEVSDEDL